MRSSRPGSGGSRRELLAAGIAAVGATSLLGGCGSSGKRSLKTHHKTSIAPGDVAILNALLDVENYAIAAYTASIPLLQPPAVTAATLFLGQELAHAGSLTVLIRRAGGKPIEPRPSYDLGHPSKTDQLLALLHYAERLQLGAYLEMIPRLSDGRVRSAAVAIFANEAQHIAVLRSQLRLDPAPAAFVTANE